MIYQREEDDARQLPAWGRVAYNIAFVVSGLVLPYHAICRNPRAAQCFDGAGLSALANPWSSLEKNDGLPRDIQIWRWAHYRLRFGPDQITSRCAGSFC